MQIGHRIINRQNPPFIIAEISSNHGGSLQEAKRLIYKAKQCGCDAVKFQTYEPEDITLDPELIKGYQEHAMPMDWHEELFNHARHVGIMPITSVFSPDKVDFLEELGCQMYKVASFEAKHYPLLWKLKETGKPIIISDGCMEFSDLTFIDTHFSGNNTIVMRCVSNYPAKPEDFNLKVIKDMRKHFSFEIGLSDHTNGNAVSTASIALGATVIERHFTLSRNGKPDDDVSLTPDEMGQLVKDVNDAWLALGEPRYGNTSEYERSLHAIEDIRKGEPLEGKIELLRPNKGMHAISYYGALKTVAYRDFKKGEPIDRLEG